MKKDISYGTPRQYQKGWESESRSNPAKLPASRAKYCKKLKGLHSMELKEVKKVKWYPFWQKKITEIKELRCRGCNKKEVMYVEKEIV